MRTNNTFAKPAVLCLFLALTQPTVHAKIIYVDDDAPPPGDGVSWTTAYTYLQDALADANDSQEPVEIRVAQGTYKPDRGAAQPAGTRDRNVSFAPGEGVVLKGGYAGIGAPDPNTRDVEVYATILTGDLADNDTPMADPWGSLDTDPTRIDNSFCVVIAEAGDANVTLDGIVITGACLYRSEGEPSPDDAGGLYVARDTRVTLRNCVFAANVAPGIHGAGTAELTVVDCTFRDNINDAGGGGGMHIAARTAHVIGCTFERNHAIEGGGIYNWSDYGYLQVEDCVFRDNATPWGPTGYGTGPYIVGSVGGGLHSYGPGDLLRCEFQGNSAGAGGGASLESDWTVRDCVFRDNRSYESGGALLLQGASQEIAGCTFAGNTSSGDGGAVYDRGSHIDFTACTFAGNTALYGGAICARYATNNLPRATWTERGFHVAMNNCTAADNLSGEGRTVWCSGLGSTDDSETSDLILSNCILDNGGDEIRYRGTVQISVTHTDLRGGLDSIQDPCESVFWGPGNIDVDPLFASPGYWDSNDTPDDASDDFFVEGDYHLKSQAGRWDEDSASWVVDDVTSPCIDAGDPNSDVGAEVWPHGGRINMGAYGSTREASLSAQPTEMFLPHIACIYWYNSDLAKSCQSFLQAHACSVTLVRSEQLPEHPLDDYDLIMIATDTPSPAVWADEQAISALLESGKPILGLGYGGYEFFGKLGLAIGHPHGASGTFDSVGVVDPNIALFDTPYPIAVPENGILQLCTSEVNHALIYLWPAPETVTMPVSTVDNAAYSPVAAEQGHLFWGFADSPNEMTETGKRLFLNAVILTANAKLEPETSQTP